MAMQSMPFLLRQSLRSPGGLSTLSSTARPIRINNPSATPRALLLHASRGRETTTTRDFSVCRRCQFRSQLRLYSSSSQKNSEKDGKVGGGGAAGETTTAADSATTLPQEGDVPKPEETRRDGSSSELNNTGNIQEGGKENNTGGGGGGGLPSYLENRRSRFSKQFSTMMDNVQSNVFVAGQRLNDLTGYSSIEALKNDIHIQEDRLRSARRHVREAKDNYASAINRRSTSQREVNELLQRKHAWSSADLERFTHLYRNDHTNEVSENETQEILSMAEREAEEAATQLSKSILSRYHEEQVWSDKIRRMSTWGTWGLMGVNVLLFLIFQIGVEPWRRHRLVKGFEEKVIEALEKEKTMSPPAATTTQAAQAEIPTAGSNTTATTPSSTTTTTTTQEQVPLQSSTTETPDIPAAQVSTTTTTTNTDENALLEAGKSRIPPPSTSIESWQRTFHELFSDRILSITQRDLTSVAIQSAAAGAAVMGLVIAIIRPR